MKTANSTITAEEMLNAGKYKALRLPTIYKKFLGILPLNFQWTMLLHGIKGSGKSTYALSLAIDLSQFGNVLYGNFEEGVGPTLQNKINVVNRIKRSKQAFKKISFLNTNTADNLWEQLDTGKYKYCVIDSVSMLVENKQSTKDFYRKLKDYSQVSFIIICHTTKKGDNYKGATEHGHLVDIVQVVEQGVVWNNDKNRWLGVDCSKAPGYNIFKNSIKNKIH